MCKYLKVSVLNIVLAIVMILGMLSPMRVEAGISDEAEDYELGEVYSGLGNGNKYYRFSISEMSHVSFQFSNAEESDSSAWTKLEVYDSNGKMIISNDDFIYKKDLAEGRWKTAQFRVLKKGIYFFKIDDSSRNEHEFSIQAEPQLSMPKGKLTTITSKTAGALELKCDKAAGAEGYRFQISRNRNFTSGVRNVYSLSNATKVKRLQKGKVYYVRVAPYAMYSDGAYALGQNSLVRNIKVKK